MPPEVVEWLNLIARWVHLVAGIMWVGNSMLFNWLDRNLLAAGQRGKFGETWLLHSGGFYRVEKFMLEKSELPPVLHWFKWQSYTTWVSGICLVVIVYYMGDAAYLIDPSVCPLSPWQAIAVSAGLLVGGWALYEGLFRTPLGRTRAAPILGLALICGGIFWLCHVFSGRGAYLQAGAMIGTLMAGNVFFYIIPSQKEMVAKIKEGKGHELELGDRAKQRSIHNNYFTFPVLFTMLSNHFGGLYGHDLNWLILLILFFASGCVRHFMNIRFTFTAWLPSLAGTVAVATVAIACIVTGAFGPKAAVATATDEPPVTFAQARDIINRRCISCHSAYPTDPIFAVATGGVHYDTPEQIKVRADRIKIRTVDLQTMPLANKTGMTDEERKIIGRWIDQGAPIP